MRRKRREKKRRTGRKPPAELVLPDRRSLEKIQVDMLRILRAHDLSSPEEANELLQRVLAENEGNIPPQEPATPLERAQDIAYEAFGASGERRVELAREALEVSPDCADAYVILAEETAGSPEEAAELYAKGVEAGQRALGEEAFEQDAGEFWGLIATRPYMRARLGLAEALWALGRREEAADHLKDMLRLNPKDNQGARYILLRYLVIMRDDAAIEKLVKRYPKEQTAEWLYTTALWLYRKGWRSPRANERLMEAAEANPDVVAYLLGLKEMPESAPAFIKVGDESEAIVYVRDYIGLWAETKGALDWLAHVVATVLLEEEDRLFDV